MAPTKKGDALALLVSQRSNAKANIQRILELVLRNGEHLSSEELDCRLEIVETYFAQALEHQSRVEELDVASENVNACFVRGELEDLYCETKVKIRSLMKKQHAVLNDTKAVDNSGKPALDHLPKLKLPTFSGKYSEFQNFISLFKTLVHNEPRLSTIEKFNHLVSCLSGPALRAIKALDFTEANYKTALALLEARFDNKYLVCQEHVQELVRLNKVKKDSAEQLRLLIDTVEAHFNALCSLLSYEEIVNTFIVHFVMSSIDSDSQSKLEEAIDCKKSIKWSDCSKILVQRCLVLETRESKPNKVLDKSSKTIALAASSNNCSCCKQNQTHPLWKCPKFLELSPRQRFDQAKKLSLCINCLSPQHTVRQCKSSTCRNCNSLHHTLLHWDTSKPSSCLGIETHREQFSSQAQQLSSHLPQYSSQSQQLSSLPQQSTSQHQQQKSSQQHLISRPQQQLGLQPQQWHMSSAFVPAGSGSSAAATTMVGQQIQLVEHSKLDNSQTILATAIIKIGDKYGNMHLARVLLDSASQLNFMTQGLAQRLKLNKCKAATVIGGIGQSQTQAKFATTASIQSRISEFKTSLQFLILPSITGLQPCCKIDHNALNIPQNFILADPQFHTPQRIDILIGADIFFELFDGQQVKLGPNHPSLMHTAFGWIVSGKCKTPTVAHSLLSTNAPVVEDDRLDELVKQFWELEKIPEAKKKWSKEHSECDAHFMETVNRHNSGRFEVRLPFKAEPTSLGDSKQMATRRFYSLERRLSTNPELKQGYVEFLSQYEAEGHMTKIDWPESLAGHYIMPHHCVLRPEKSTTKIRVVFDASAKITNNIALNEILKVGPVVQNELVDILLRFRLHRYGFTAMYRQVAVNTHDCKVQNIIWRSEANQELQLYRLNTVTYGTASAPYLATRCLVQLADENMQQYPSASEIVRNDFYVDDLISGGSTLQEIQAIKTDVSSILAQGCFQLRKWFSNRREFLSEIPEDEREKTIQINEAILVKTLGIIWDASSDSFRFCYNSKDVDTTELSKRKVLSEMSKLFDPLGLIKPVIVKAKIFLQELWLKGLNWDDPLPDDCANAWKTFVNQLTSLKTINIPRFVLQDNSTIELHGFADASTRAYGGCFYVRCVDLAGNTKITLLTSRSRVAPISTVRSLPCLELCGAHLLTQLFQKVRNITNFHNFFFWSDSVIVLNWLAEHASSFNTFVANRVSFIQEHTAGLHWQYVPSSSNPADLVSRGATVHELSSSIWFSGPQFLYKPRECWPQSPKRCRSDQLPERKTFKTILLTIENDVLDVIYAHSNFIKICRIVAYMRRFIDNCRSRVKRNQSTSLVVTASEIDDAFFNIIFLMQQLHFASEIADLKCAKQVRLTSTLKALNPFLEVENNFVILKVGGRLKHADLPYLTRCPVILPKHNSFVEAYIRHLHVVNLHAGPQALLCLIQQRFWIIGAREYTRKIVRRCVLCFRYRPKLLSQIMGDLPKHRVTPVKPFTNCGVDFCGPIMTTARIRGKPKYKSYIAVFVCLVTRAVHLEVVSALSADAFIAALKRFTGRRGLCTTIFCDNATNFVGARNLLREYQTAFNTQQFQNKITTWCSSQQIEFKHIPPRSPHFGGIWEAAVKSAKTLLYKTMQSAVLTFEELSTAVAQIEGILNSRPLTAMSSDPSDERALTPAHFLNQSRAECVLEPVTSFSKISSLKAWQQISAIQQHFWNRWSKEVLVLLQQRHKWTKDMPNIDKGTLVLVHDDNSPPQQWVLGRVIDVIKGADGKIRVADVKTQSGIIRRSITKLAALPV